MAKHDIQHAEPTRLAEMMDLAPSRDGLWHAEDLGEILSHRLSTPLAAELDSEPPTDSESSSTEADPASQPRCFRDLLQQSRPPLQQLRRLMDFARKNHRDPDWPLPTEVATLLYYAGAAALIRSGEHLGEHDPGTLLWGISWTAAQRWADEPTRGLAGEAASRLMSDGVLPPAAVGTDELPPIDESFQAPCPPGPLVPGYSLVREVSRGGQGVVYEAVRESTGRTVAVKVLRDGPLAGRTGRERFSREVQILARLRHPNIASIFDSGTTDDGWSYLVTDFIPGLPLDQYLRWGRGENGDDDTDARVASVSDVLGLFLKIARAIDVAHQAGVVHRDLKPSNILVDAAGEPHVVDFGIARTLAPWAAEPRATGVAAVTVTGQFLGSLPWSSPEQADGRQTGVDERSDVYSLGVILYQMLTHGRFPYDVTGPAWEVLRNIAASTPIPLSRLKHQPSRGTRHRETPELLQRVVLTALSKGVSDRYATAGEFARAVEAVASGASLTASGRVGLRRFAAVAVCATLLGAMIASKGFVTGKWNRNATDARHSASLEQVEQVSSDHFITPVGNAYRIGATATDEQRDPTVAINELGQFVVAWTGRGRAGDREGVFAQLYRTDGTPVGTQIPLSLDARISHPSTALPAIAMDPRGGFFVALEASGWERDGSGRGVYAGRYNAARETRSPITVVNESREGDQYAPAMSTDGRGNFVIAWLSSAEGAAETVHFRLFNINGEPRTGELIGEKSTAGELAHPSVAMRADGTFAVVWETQAPGGGGVGIYARLFDRTGAPLGEAFRASGADAAEAGCSSVCAGPDGAFAVAWVDGGPDGRSRVCARYLAVDARAPRLAPMVAAEATLGRRSRPSIALQTDGSLVVVWCDGTESASADCRVLYRVFRPDGSAASALPVSLATGASPLIHPAVVSAGRQLVAVWGQAGPTDKATAICARRFRMAPLSNGTHPLPPTSAPSSIGPIVPLGPVAQYGPYSRENNKRISAVASDPAGNHFLAWEDGPGGGVTPGISGQRLDASGNAAGRPFRVTSSRWPAWWEPAVAADDNGDFIVAYAGGASLSGAGALYVRRFRAAGNVSDAEEFEIAPLGPARPTAPSAVMRSGSYLVIWHRDIPKAGGVRGRGFDGDAGQWGPEFYANDAVTGSNYAAVGVDGLRYFTVAWATSDFVNAIWARRYDSNAARIGAEFIVSESKNRDHFFPVVAADDWGDLLIVWRASHGGQAEVLARRIDAEGALGREFAVNRRLLADTDPPAAAMNMAGQAVVVWVHSDGAGGRRTLVARRFGPSGEAIDETEQELETLPDSSPSFPSVGIDGRGNFVVSWQATSRPDTGVTVCVRRFGRHP